MTLVTALIVALSFFATLALSQGLRINHLELQLEDERERTRTLARLERLQYKALLEALAVQEGPAGREDRAALARREVTGLQRTLEQVATPGVLEQRLDEFIGRLGAVRTAPALTEEQRRIAFADDEE